jgi:hypothetical protein
MDPIAEHEVFFKQPSCVVLVRSKDDGKVLGSAMLRFVDQGIAVQLFLDAHTPEAFDMEVAPEKVHPQMELALTSDGAHAIVWM